MCGLCVWALCVGSVCGLLCVGSLVGSVCVLSGRLCVQALSWPVDVIEVSCADMALLPDHSRNIVMGVFSHVQGGGGGYYYDGVKVASCD